MIGFVGRKDKKALFLQKPGLLFLERHQRPGYKPLYLSGLFELVAFPVGRRGLFQHVAGGSLDPFFGKLARLEARLELFESLLGVFAACEPPVGKLRALSRLPSGVDKPLDAGGAVRGTIGHHVVETMRVLEVLYVPINTCRSISSGKLPGSLAFPESGFIRTGSPAFRSMIMSRTA